MKINRIMGISLVLLSLGLASLGLTGCQKPAGEQQAKKYTCTHHPEVVQDTPGKCPKCNMDLVEKK